MSPLLRRLLRVCPITILVLGFDGTIKSRNGIVQIVRCQVGVTYRHGERGMQVKSRYATDCDRGFPVKAKTFEAFDFLVVAFLNIGHFFNKRDGRTGQCDPEFFTLSRTFVQEHQDPTSTWGKVKLRGLLPLAHPRQVARLGRSSKVWFDAHAAWAKRGIVNLIR